ncbi:hypothetical protein DLJ49_12250 [Rhodovulum sp. 12E13]|uniref:hypothetical protein n=1 Tax=Rhodovulum sp. 12E13 TaxID=2203891 RepID=UPI000E12EE4D|nr:hypothetical protein [Rhodovulum sp. 12E13]RDC72124.1 hypothetical protein DLJ49_12250 [Rhodovulum sp. 12E13]
MIDRLQRLCAYVFLVSAGTLAAALVLIRARAWLGLPPAPPGETSLMVPVVVGLVMALTGSGLAWVALAFLAGMAPGLRRITDALRRHAEGRSRAELALWGVAALAALGLLAGLW